MYNLSDSGRDVRFANVLKELQAMPNDIISYESEYREKTLFKNGVTEEELTMFIDSNSVFDLSLDEHALDLREKAYEYRASFREDFSRLLLSCDDEDEKLELLQENDCTYSRWAYESLTWDRHQFKSFKQFAQWHIEQGGWKRDFQGKDFDSFARSWALSWMGKWISQQLTLIGTRRVKESENHLPKLHFNCDTEQLNSELRKKEELAKNDQLRSKLECWRRKYIRDGLTIKGSNWAGALQDDDLKLVIFVVQSLDNLKADLERRLSTSKRKEELLTTELKIISSTLDDAFTSTVDLGALRRTLNVNQSIDLSRFEDKSDGTGMKGLAIYWDIAHYEVYLKDMIAELNAVKPQIEKRNETETNIPHIETLSPPTITISLEAQQNLIDAITPFVDRSDHENLKDLLKQGIAAIPITIQCQQNSIAYIFRQAKEAGHIDETKTKIRDWILYWLRIKDDKSKGSKRLSSTTVYDSLSKDKAPPKSKRIPYTPKK